MQVFSTFFRFFMASTELPASTGKDNITVKRSARRRTIAIRLKNDGSVMLENGAGFVRLMADGTVNINGFTVDPSGNVVSPANMAVKGDLQNDGVNVGKTHTHGGVQTGGGNTGTPN